MKYLISGGGTGGHIYPALAIANEIKSRDPNADILYVGTKDGLESRLVPREGINFKSIRVKGMPRSLNKASFIALKELIHGLNDSKKIIKDFQPDIVIGTGGYVCGPIVYKAKKMGIASLIHEQNAFPGITNKILGRYVDKIAVTFEESIKYFKYPHRITITGNPIRKEILAIDREKAYDELKISKDLPFVLSFGGSGGQKSLNDAILGLIKNKSIGKDYQLIHVTGERFYDDIMKNVDKLELGDNIQLLPYLYNISYALNIADLVVTSAGAITLAEISALGLASILIPKGYTAENHQEYNAKSFEKNEAAHLILEKDLNDKLLDESIRNILFNQVKLSEMGKNSKMLGNIDAAEKIYDLIEGLILKE